MNKSFYMASLVLLATIAAKQKKLKSGSFSMEELFQLANTRKVQVLGVETQTHWLL